jgi:hypothetical protein
MTTYRKRRPYRKAQTYDGAEVVPAVVVPNNHGGTGLRWNPATEATRGTMTCWDGQPAAHHADVVAPFDAIAPHDCARQVPFGSMAAHNDPLDAPWSPIAPHERDAGVPWLPMDAHAVSPNAPWGDLQGRHAKPHAAPFGQITPHDVLLSAPSRRLRGRPVGPGRGPPWWRSNRLAGGTQPAAGHQNRPHPSGVRDAPNPDRRAPARAHPAAPAERVAAVRRRQLGVDLHRAHERVRTRPDRPGERRAARNRNRH